jgi:hypothetical protein
LAGSPLRLQPRLPASGRHHRCRSY